MAFKIWGSGLVPSHRAQWRGLFSAGIAAILMSPAYGASNELRLEDAIRLTIDLNPGLKQYPLQYELLNARKHSASLKPALQLGAEIENIGGSGNYSGTNVAESTLSLSSVLERGRKRAARIDEVDQQISTATLERELAVTNLAAEVAEQFTKVAAAQEAVIIKQVEVELQQQIEREVAKRVRAGASPDAELLRVRAAVADSEGKLSAANNQLTTERLKLSSFWLAGGTDAYHVQASLYQLPAPLPVQQLDELAEANPEILLLVQRIATQDAAIKRVDANSSTDIGWRLGVRNFAETDDTAFTLGFELPLFSGGRNRSATTESQLEKQSLQLQKMQAVWRFKQRLQELNQRLIASNTEAQTLAGDILPLQQQALAETKKAYNRGRYSFTELAAEQRRLNELKQRQLDAATRSHLINIELERLLGQTLPHSSR